MNLYRKLFGNIVMEGDPAPAGGSAPAAEAPAAAPAAEVSTVLGEAQKPADAPAGDAPSVEGENPEGDKPAEGAPETYEAFTVPEAMQGLELDEAATSALGDLFKELGLPQDKAQAAFEKLLGIQQALGGTPEQQEQAIQERVAKMNGDWTAACKADPDIGGQNWDASVRTMAKVMAAAGDEDFSKLLTSSALGSHPAMVKFVVRVGRLMSEDVLVDGGETAREPQRAADVMFGHLFNK